MKTLGISVQLLRLFLLLPIWKVIAGVQEAVLLMENNLKESGQISRKVIKTPWGGREREGLTSTIKFHTLGNQMNLSSTPVFIISSVTVSSYLTSLQLISLICKVGRILGIA